MSVIHREHSERNKDGKKGSDRSYFELIGTMHPGGTRTAQSIIGIF